MTTKQSNKETYKLIACCFNNFFLETKPADLIRDLKEYLKNDNLITFLSESQQKRLFNYYEEWVEFKNKWFKPNYDAFSCPFEWYFSFLQDCEKHLKNLLLYASECHRIWLKGCIKNSKHVTWDKLSELKKEIDDHYQDTSKEALQEEEEFSVDELIF